MKVERVRILKTLKSGEKIWGKGEVIEPPLPEELIKELKLDRGTVQAVSMIKGQRPSVVLAKPTFKEPGGNAPRSTATSIEVPETETPQPVKRVQRVKRSKRVQR